ncbi:MAG: sugar transporter permease [Paenibacillaceae bacterium]|jgi:putative aldouronate transport system permease protein|nr:sugar transporter permease [Paenibacillaceae bacterium]
MPLQLEVHTDQAVRPLAKTRGRKHFRIIKKYRVFYFMMLPALLFLLFNNYLPMAGVLIAFKNINYTDGYIHSPWSGFNNFRFLFDTRVAWELVRNTLIYNAVFIVLNLVMGVLLALMFHEMRSRRAAKLHQSAMFLPYLLSWVVIGYLVFAFLGMEHGLLNTYLFPKLGWDPVEWYSNWKYWPYILPVVNTWRNVGYFAVIYLASMLGIDPEYYEAAVIDGATKRQQILNITLPLIRPVIIVMTLLQIGRIFYADFGLFFQVTQNAGALYPATQVIDTYVYNTFLVMGDIGMSSAAGLFQALVGFILVLATNLVIRKISKEDALF